MLVSSNNESGFKYMYVTRGLSPAEEAAAVAGTEAAQLRGEAAAARDVGRVKRLLAAMGGGTPKRRGRA